MAERNPLVSVIMPVYNVERYVEQSVKSVLGQSLKDFELIVVDDCSTDRSIEICQRLAQSDRRIKIIRQEKNLGPGSARNTGLDKARGDFIFFLDSDDLLAVDAFKILVDAARNNNAEVVHCNSYVRRVLKADGSIDGEDQLIRDPKPNEGFLTTDRNVRLENVYSQFEMRVQVWLNLYRRDFLEKNQLRFPDMMAEDEPFFIALLCCADRFYCILDYLYLYNRRAGSETSSNSSERAARGVASLIEGCRYIGAAIDRQQSVKARTKSICIQEFIERISRNYILRRYDESELFDADAVENFIKALTPAFDGNSELAALLLQGLALRQLTSMKLRAEDRTPAISVIMPVYNVERYVEESVMSVLGQKFVDFELLIVDDASPDRSIEICRRLAQSDRRIKIIRHEKNKGLGAARNTGMNHARGKYVYFIDSDDFLFDNALSDLFNAAEQSNADVVHSTGFYECGENADGSIDRNLTLKTDKEIFNGLLPPDRNARLINCYVNYNCWSMVWLNLYRREFLEKNNLRFPNIISEDEPFAIALYCLAERVAFIPNRFYIYNRRRGSLTGSNNPDRVSKAISAIVEGHEYITSIMNRLPESALATGVRNVCIQNFFSRMLENHILPFCDLDSVMSAEALKIFVDSLRPKFGDNADYAAHLLQAYVIQRLKASDARREIAQLQNSARSDEPQSHVKNLYRDEIRDGFFVDVARKKLWNVQLKLILEVERICRKHNLKWFAFGGTLLGAARHKGFIPWDDDVDLCMLRPDYEKFKRAAAAELNPNYFLDLWYNYAWEGEPNDENLFVVDRRAEWPIGCMFLKIRDSRTTMLMSGASRKNINNGIFIDVMPLDPVPPFDDDKHNADFEIARELHYAVKNPEVIVKALNDNSPLLISRDDLKQILQLPFKQRALLYENFQAEHFFESEFVHRFEAYVWRQKKFRVANYREALDMPFEQITIPVPVGYDDLLTAQYGNWREPVFTHTHGNLYSVDVSYKDYFRSVTKTVER